MSYVIFAIVVYILYRFIFGFVLPVLTVSRKMQQGMRDMHSNMNSRPTTAEPTEADPRYTSSKTHKNTKPSSNDYIDFEEVK